MKNWFKVGIGLTLGILVAERIMVVADATVKVIIDRVLSENKKEETETDN